jgi:hypothetical protein
MDSFHGCKSNPERVLATRVQQSTFQANQAPTLQVSFREPPTQVAALAPPFRFQGGPQATPSTPPSQSFTFEAGPAYPTPVLTSGFSPINAGNQASPTYTGYHEDLDKLHCLEGEVEDLQKQYADLQREVELLRQQDKQKKGTSPRESPAPPSPPAVDRKAELRRLAREEDYKAAVAEQAHKDAKRTEAEVRAQARQDEIEDRRHEWWDKNKGRAITPPHPFPVTPATLAAPETTFSTTLAYRPASVASQNTWHLAVGPIPIPSPSRIPLPSRSRSRSRSRSPERDSVETPTRSHDRPVPQGILRKPDNQRQNLPNPPKLVRFNNVIDYLKYSTDDEWTIILDE